MTLAQINFEYLNEKDKFKCLECGKRYKMLGPHLDNHFMKHKMRGGEHMRAQRQLRFWTQNEINTALDMVNEGKDLDTIASAVERTKQGVKTMVYHFEAYKMGKQISSMSGSWREQFARYLKSNKNVAESLRDEVQEANGKVTPMGSDAKLEALLQTVETNWNQTLQAVSNLVEYEVNRRVTEEKAKNENELRELRAFKEQAKDSNIAGTLRKSLMSFRS